MDHAVIRLLLNLNKDTHVLVLAQSRVRNFLKNKAQALYYNSVDLPGVEFTESLFLAKLKRLRELMENDDELLRKDVFDIFYGKSLQDNQQYRLLQQTYSAMGDLHYKNRHEKMDTKSIAGELLPLNDILKNKRVDKNENALSSFSERASIWFWDTSLPFNLAAIRDCETLYSHDPITVQLLRFMSIFDDNKLGFIYQMERIEANQSKYNISINPNLFSGNPLNKFLNKQVIQSKKSLYFLRKHPTTKDNLTSIFYAALDDYFDQFAGAYMLPNLRCNDFHHAGAQTERIEITQIFNLICNRHLKLTDEYCCSQ